MHIPRNINNWSNASIDKKKSIWVLRPVKIISLILSWINGEVGLKQEISEKKHLTTHWPCLTYDLGSNPQKWDDKQFAALKISVLNDLPGEHQAPNASTECVSNNF